MKKHIKIVSLLVSIITVILFCSFAPSIDETALLNIKYYNNIGKSINTHSAFVEEFAKQFEESYPDNYAGAFIDESGELNILVVQNDFQQINNISATNIQLSKELNKISFYSKNLKLNESMNYKYAKHSMNALKNIQTILDKKMEEFSIMHTSILEDKNIIEIGLSNLDNQKNILSFLLLEIPDLEISAISFVKSNAITNEAYYGFAGHKIKYNSGFLGLTEHYGTIGFNATDTRTGKKGVVTNAHVAPKDQEMKNAGGKIIGKPLRWQYSGKLDAAFIPFPNSDWVASAKIQGEDYKYKKNFALNEFVVGMPTAKCGVSTGTTYGKITTVSVTINTGEATISDAFAYSNNSNSGDSGGPVYYGYIGPIKSINEPVSRLYGIHCASGGTARYGIKAANILSTLQLTLIT